MPRQISVGPSWTEVFLGALLSLVLGVTFGAAFLVLKPAVLLKQPLKEGERKANTIYYMEGSRDGSKAREAEAKRKSFVQGSSVVVTEEHLNLSIPTTKAAAPAAPAAPAPKGKEGEKVEPPAATAVLAPPNLRIRDNLLQIATPVKVSVFGVESTIMVLARGTFVKEDSGFVFAPETISAGSCPLDRLPVVKNLVYNKFIRAQPVPDDIAAAWPKLVGVHVEGSELKLVMP